MLCHQQWIPQIHPEAFVIPFLPSMAPGSSLASDEGSGLGCDVIERQGCRFRGVELQTAVAEVSAGHPRGLSRVLPNVKECPPPPPPHASDFSLGRAWEMLTERVSS